MAYVLQYTCSLSAFTGRYLSFSWHNSAKIYRKIAFCLIKVSLNGTPYSYSARIGWSLVYQVRDFSAILFSNKASQVEIRNQIWILTLNLPVCVIYFYLLYSRKTDKFMTVMAFSCEQIRSTRFESLQTKHSLYLSMLWKQTNTWCWLNASACVISLLKYLFISCYAGRCTCVLTYTNIFCKLRHRMYMHVLRWSDIFDALYTYVNSELYPRGPFYSRGCYDYIKIEYYALVVHTRSSAKILEETCY